MKIEEYIKANNVDVYNPQIEKLWEGIEQKRNKSKIKRLKSLRWVAALFIASLFVAVLIRQEILLQQQISTLSQINNELRQQEQQYTKQVSAKWNVYTNMPGNDSPIAPMLKDELQNLDTLYQNGMEKLLEYGYNEKLVITLMNTYEKRLRIIEYLILEKQKQKNYERKVQKRDV